MMYSQQVCEENVHEGRENKFQWPRKVMKPYKHGAGPKLQDVYSGNWPRWRNTQSDAPTFPYHEPPLPQHSNHKRVHTVWAKGSNQKLLHLPTQNSVWRQNVVGCYSVQMPPWPRARCFLSLFSFPRPGVWSKTCFLEGKWQLVHKNQIWSSLDSQNIQARHKQSIVKRGHGSIELAKRSQSLNLLLDTTSYRDTYHCSSVWHCKDKMATKSKGTSTNKDTIQKNKLASKFPCRLITRKSVKRGQGFQETHCSLQRLRSFDLDSKFHLLIFLFHAICSHSWNTIQSDWGAPSDAACLWRVHLPHTSPRIQT